MNIQGIGQSFSAYQSMSMRGTQGTNDAFDPSTIDAGTIMKKEDANLDGVLTINETQLSEDMFSNADTDANGELTTEELEEILSNPPPMMSGGMGMPGMNGAGGMGQIDAESIIAQEDTDEDGSISTEETSLTEEIFSELDTNEDGTISLEELQAGMAEKKEEMKNSQGFSLNQTVTQDQIMAAYHMTVESFMTNFSEGNYIDSSISQFLGTIA